MAGCMTIVRGDITQERVDAIVNAANTTLLGGGGVDGAIHHAAGPELLDTCRALGGCPTGEVRVTPGFRLHAPWLLHTVGPVWLGGDADETRLLASCYREVFRHLANLDLGRVALPAISTGVYGFPAAPAARIAVTEASRALAARETLREVRFVCFTDAVEAAYRAVLAPRSAPVG